MDVDTTITNDIRYIMDALLAGVRVQAQYQHGMILIEHDEAYLLDAALSIKSGRRNISSFIHYAVETAAHLPKEPYAKVHHDDTLVFVYNTSGTHTK